MEVNVHPDDVAKMDQLKTMSEYAIGEFREARDLVKNLDGRVLDLEQKVTNLAKRVERVLVEANALRARLGGGKA